MNFLIQQFFAAYLLNFSFQNPKSTLTLNIISYIMYSKKDLFFIVLLFAVCVWTNKLKIRNQDGIFIPMAYDAPQIFKPIPRSQIQEPPEDITLTNLKAATEIVDQFSSSIVNLSRQFYQRNNQSLIHQAEYIYYNRKYNLDKGRPEIPICVVSPFHNFFSSKSWENYLDTLENQNYTNFQVIMTDDQSTDNSTIKILKLVEKDFPRLSRRLTLLKTKQYTEMMGNHDIQIRNHCQEGSIIMEVDGDDTLIGRQVMNLINAYYTDNPQIWVVYSNFLTKSMTSSSYILSKKIPDKIYDENTYRTNCPWITSHLKTYYRAVYMKIPPDYFWRAPGLYYYYGADIFIMIAIIELSGKTHTHYLKQILYYYTNSGGCSSQLNLIGEKLARMKTPFLPLKDLDDTAHLTENYTVPSRIIQQYNRAVTNGYKCIEKLRQKLQDPTYMSKINT